MDLASNNQIEAAKELIQKASEILRVEEEIDRRSGRRFNAFRALGIERSELLHSRFLACLLDPHEIHDQEDIFLKTFLQDVLQEQIQGLDLTVSKIATELSTHHGKFDIVITLPDKRIIVIENKVDAREGEEQIKRYQCWINNQPGGPHRLVFLTPDGRTPSSCDPADVKKVKCVSYEMIIDWLNKLKKKIPEIPVPITLVLDQYINLWEAIPMKREVIDMLNDPRYFEAAAYILKAVEEVKESTRRKFLDRIYDDLKNRLNHSKLSEYWDVPMPKTPSTDEPGGVGLQWRSGRNDGAGHFAVYCEAYGRNWSDVFIGISRGAKVPSDKQDARDKDVAQRFVKEGGQRFRQPNPWWTAGLFLRELVGRKAIDLKDLIIEGEQLSKLVADELWELFEAYRMELEDLNRNYPY